MYIFVAEAVLKIFALGFYKGDKTYLKNAWNVLDFFIVIAGLAEICFTKYADVNLRPFRTLRILRPLKAVK